MILREKQANRRYFMMNNSKLEELLNTARINELLHKKELEEKNKNGIIIALAIIGAIAADRKSVV